MCCSPYTTCTQAASSILRSEGVRAFYRSYGTQLAMNLPFQMAIVTTYSVIQQRVNPEGRHLPVVHFLAGAVAGGVACALTMPFDVCKTLLNTQEAGVLSKISQTKVVGLWGAGAVVYRVTGLPGFFQGLSARVLYQAPSTAISWTVYEFFKYLLREKQGASSSSAAREEYETIDDLTRRASSTTAAPAAVVN